MDFVALFEVALDAKRHLSTGFTRHSIGLAGVEMTRPSYLRIVKADPDVYLFYCDLQWRLLNDTWHDSVEDAKTQASLEFGVEERDWMSLGPDGKGIILSEQDLQIWFPKN